MYCTCNTEVEQRWIRSDPFSIYASTWYVEGHTSYSTKNKSMKRAWETCSTALRVAPAYVHCTQCAVVRLPMFNKNTFDDLIRAKKYMFNQKKLLFNQKYMFIKLW